MLMGRNGLSHGINYHYLSFMIAMFFLTSIMIKEWKSASCFIAMHSYVNETAHDKMTLQSLEN